MNSYTWRAGIIDSNLPPTTRHVLLTLSCHINDAGEETHPSTKRLARETGLSEKSVITHLLMAKELGWLTVRKHGFSDRRWARNEYSPAFPQGTERGSAPHRALKEVQHLDQQGTERGSAPQGRGTEPDDHEALKEVQSNYQVELPRVIGGGSGRDSGAGAKGGPMESPPPPDMEVEVERIKQVHLQTCGLVSVPPLQLIREVLRSGKPPRMIDDIYQSHGGDVQMYRQRNIVERLTALRDGVERSPPGSRRRDENPRQKQRQELALQTAQSLIAGGPPGGCRDG